MKKIKNIEWKPGDSTFKYLGYEIASKAYQALELVVEKLRPLLKTNFRIDNMHWSEDKYRAIKGSAVKEQFVPIIVLFSEFIKNIRKIVARRREQWSYCYRDCCHNSSKILDTVRTS